MRATAVLVLMALVNPALAEQYWIEYDPSAGLYPEQVGWTRYTHAGGDQRSFDDGALVLDGLASRQIADYYGMCRPGGLDPGPGELFVARWVLRVTAVDGYGDPFVSVNADDGAGVAFLFDEGSIMNVLEPGVQALFAPGEYHQFELRSSDMASYELLIDGVPALDGMFHQEISTSRIIWGDGAIGSASLTYWRAFGFGVVPEPTALALLVCISILALRARTARDSGDMQADLQEVP